MASSIWRMRVAGLGGNSQPYCLYSASFRPAPMPSVSRPRLIRSTPAAILARCAGLRNATEVASVANRMRFVTAASADSTVQPSIKGSVGADATDLDQVVHDREPDKAVTLGPLRLCFDAFERVGWVGAVHPGRVVNAEFHDPSSLSVGLADRAVVPG
jgi:hypothetical protein